MKKWVVGQRVIAKNESDLGIASIESITHSQITVLFTLQNEKRIYNKKSPPIRRFLFEIDQEIVIAPEKKIRIKKIVEQENLFYFQDQEGAIYCENQVIDALENSNALKMFSSGLNTSFPEYRVRRNIWKTDEAYGRTKLQGLVGPRIQEVKHQLFIADKLSKRSRIRALLSDEVGLGKTIEAGLIYSILTAQNRAQRTLIIVPEALSNQWLAEYYRKFSTLFSIISHHNWDEELQSQEKNPFELNARVISNFDFLENNKSASQALCSTQWDLVIIDEVHRLLWNEDDIHPSWEICKQISQATEHLLLLSATPKKHGPSQLFGLLNLLDETQFNDFYQYLERTQKQKEISEIAQKIHQADISQVNKTRETLQKKFSIPPSVQSKIELIDFLNDQHGLSKMHFHNRRENFENFPKRELFEHPFEDAHEKLSWLKNIIESSSQNEKFLLICKESQEAKRLYLKFKKTSGKEFALFTEEMPLVERDRQAAWFMNPEHQVSVLFCSEIGGEGRNFQKAQNLILWDLPEDSDTLEQRIGRLDRIGQLNTIKIHVPYIKSSSEEIFFHFFHHGMNSFLKFCPFAGKIFQECQEQLSKCLNENSKISTLLEHTKKVIPKIKKDYQESTDFLLDFNSFQYARSQEVYADLNAWKRSQHTEKTLLGIFDTYALDYDDFGLEKSYKINPEALMFSDNFPGFSNGKNRSITFDKPIALAREDIEFISVESPFYLQSKEFFLNQHKGKCGASLYKGFLEKKEQQSPYYAHLFFIAQPKIKNPYTHPIHFEEIVNHKGLLVEKESLNFSSKKVIKLSETQSESLVPQVIDSLENCLSQARSNLKEVFSEKLHQYCTDQNKLSQSEIEILELKLKRAPENQKTPLEADLVYWKNLLLSPDSFTIDLDSFHLFLIQK